MPYDERFVAPMRQELTRLGVRELRTPAEVDATLRDARGTTLVVVNSICGCAARNARPAVALALEHPRVPDALTTVFAGQDIDATARARSYFTGYGPSSPQSGSSRTASWSTCSSGTRSRDEAPHRSLRTWSRRSTRTADPGCAWHIACTRRPV